MTEPTPLVAMKHSELDGRIIDVPDTAVPVYRQSGWEPLTKKEQAERDKEQAAATAAAEQSMRALADAALAVPPPGESPNAPETSASPKENG